MEQELVSELFEIGCVKFGEFTLKSGIKSPIYFDMRILVSFPKLMNIVSEVFAAKIKEQSLDFDLICGVPYGAISLATGVSLKTDKPMIFKRKETKSHGTKKIIEGIYNTDDRCLVIDDVVTSGISIMETVDSLRENHIQVTDAVVLLDREQGGFENVKNGNVQLHSIFRTKEILNILFTKNKIDQDTYDRTNQFLEMHKHIPIHQEPEPTQHLDFQARSKLTKNKISKRLFEIMSLKQTNLCVAADFNNFDQLLKTADDLGPYICILKTHIDMLNDFSLDKVQQLVDLSLKHNFLIFEDRKFADIGNTVKQQFSEGIYKISKWADIINAHSITGSGCVEGLKQACDEVTNKSCLLIAQLSSKGNLIDDNYIKETVKIAEDNKDFVIGFISQKRVCNDPAMVHIAPGIQLKDDSMRDTLGQQYVTPEMSIIDQKCDIIVVGRGIINSDDPIATALKYKQIAYNSYLKRISFNDF